MSYAVAAYIVTAVVLIAYAARVVTRERALARTVIRSGEYSE